MTLVKSLRLLSAVLGGAAACAVVGTTVFGDVRSGSPTAPAVPVATATPKFDANKVIDELAKTKFSDKPVLAYKNPAGETIFAWQVKPVLPVTAARPRDVLVLVDTSASQAGDPMKHAGSVIEALGKKLGADDRLDIWTLNIDSADHTRSLTKGFQAPTDKSIAESIHRLANTEYAAGSIDLKAGLDAVAKKFEGKAARQQIILYLGDGESTSGTPITEQVRVELGNRLADQNTQFFAVPLGLTVSANNLHGLSMSTGGLVIRAKENLSGTNGSADFAKRLCSAFDAPVLKADKATFGIAGVELLPNRLPPLRADRSTLVLGKLPAPVASLTLTIEGTVAGKNTTVELAERLPASSGDHFFLNAMLAQWNSAGSKDAPVILAADRALAMAGEQFRLFRDEFVELGMKAISADRFDHAEKLFQAAVKIDPQHDEALAGTKVVAQLRSGEMTKDKLKARMDKNVQAGRKLVALQEPVPAPGGVAPVAPPGPGGIARAQAARAAADQEARAIVEETLKQVRVLKASDPDRALEDLKRQRETILLNSDLSDDTRRRLVADLEASMRDIQVQGAEIKRRLSLERDRISAARYKLNENDRLLSQEEQTKARIDRFRDLMSQARFELAYQEAQVMAQERISRGQAIPPEVTATYRIGQSATNLREFTELKRIREDRYLMCMLQVEKSFIPYPDEPPVHFPPAQVWRELTKNRQENYTTYDIGGDPTARQRMKRVKSILEDQRVNFPNSLKDTPLRTLKEQLEKQFDIKIVVREDLFRLQDMTDGEIMDRKFKLDSNLSGVSLGSFLDVALLDIKASYIVRPEYIEITTLEQRLEEKVTLAFAVADLVLAIPSSVNPQTLQQNSQFQASQLSIFGVGQAQQFGNAGFGGGQFGQGGGQFGQGGLGQGGLGQGGIGMGGGQLGMLGMGNLGQGGGNNLGVGGGVLGAAGGQLGQFGNLGGQFGIQGNDQSRFLTALIQTVVARGEWDNVVPGVPPPPTEPGETPAALVPPAQLNSLGFYPPVRALVIRGSTRYHPTQSFKLRVPGAAGGAQAPRQGDPNVLGQVNAPQLQNPILDPRALAKAAKGNPHLVWNEALAKHENDPMLIVNTVDIMNDVKEHDHTTELLKATIRHGRANANWTHEALAIALRSSNASVGEVERASLSGIDLDPKNAKEYIKAAKAESELGRNDQAIALCKRAATLEPNLPDAYANALVYVERSTDVATDVVGWATENLMKRDWTNDGVDYLKQTKARVGAIAKKLADAGRAADADKINKGLTQSKSRDLLVEVRWQGQGDVDMSVAEPSGSTASATAKRTSGGGVLRSDILEQGDDDRSEVYSASEAFSGTYKVTVKTSLGRAVGNKALVKVTKFPGTPKEAFEIFAVDLANPKPIEFKLEGGTRKDLANVPTEDDSNARVLTTSAPKSYVPSGVGGGAGLANPDLTVFTGGTAAANMPLVTPSVETKFDSISPVLPGVRVVGKVSTDRSTLEYTASTVFTGPAVDIPMPKVNLLPGSERNK